MAVSNLKKQYTNYDDLTSYTAGNIVNYQNQLYIKNLTSTPVIPTNTTYWNKLWSNQTKNNA